MLSELVKRNSERNRKDNRLFFATTIIVVVAFYIILSLERHDIIRFLKIMESDAVKKLLMMIPFFYGVSLFLLFFLVYYAGKFQMGRRSREFGVYMTLGMTRKKLFTMLLLEDVRNSLISLGVGLPLAVFFSELISLTTVKLVGIGILGHKIGISGTGFLATVSGFLAVKFAAFLVLSTKVVRSEIGDLLSPSAKGEKKLPNTKKALPALLFGILLLGFAYKRGITGEIWKGVKDLLITVIPGISGTFLFLYGLRTPIGKLAKGGSEKKLRAYTFRQVEEAVIHESHTLAACSLIILSALSFFAVGIGVGFERAEKEEHVLDYTFTSNVEGRMIKLLKEKGLRGDFSDVFEIRLDYPKGGEDADFTSLKEEIEKNTDKDRANQLTQWFDGRDPYLIESEGYNRILKAAGKEALDLADGEAAIYAPEEFIRDFDLLSTAVKKKLKIRLSGKELTFKDRVVKEKIVTDRVVNIGFALIVNSKEFGEMGSGGYDTVFTDAILDPKLVEGKKYITACLQMNEKLDKAGFVYESHLQNIGRRLVYTVAASYSTLYLAIVFFVIANTVIGVQFLMGQRKNKKRYRILLHLGADYQTVCKAGRKQIHWYFGIPAGMALLNTGVGIRSLLQLLPESGGKPLFFILAGSTVFLLILIEWMYLSVVKRASDRFILSLMEPEREDGL